jgi:ribonuclease HI
MTFYAVASGKTIGIFLNWGDCSNSVKGYKNALFKKFDTREQAESFIAKNRNINESKNEDKFDATNINNKNNDIRDIHVNDCVDDKKQQSIKSFSDVNPNKTVDFISDYFVYTDGACSNNGRNNSNAGIGIFFGIDDPRNVSEKIEGKQTNNIAELKAIIKTYSIIENDILNGKKVTIVSDSEYSIKCVSSYGEKCYKKNWNVDIPNKELVKTAYEIYKDQPNIQFMHIRAHTNKSDIHSIGNDNADKLANVAIGLESCPYQSTRIYLSVPFTKKDEIKKLGGLWDTSKKKWFINENNKNKTEILNLFPIE